MSKDTGRFRHQLSFPRKLLAVGLSALLAVPVFALPAFAWVTTEVEEVHLEEDASLTGDKQEFTTTESEETETGFFEKLGGALVGDSKVMARTFMGAKSGDSYGPVTLHPYSRIRLNGEKKWEDGNDVDSRPGSITLVIRGWVDWNDNGVIDEIDLTDPNLTEEEKLVDERYRTISMCDFNGDKTLDYKDVCYWDSSSTDINGDGYVYNAPSTSDSALKVDDVLGRKDLYYDLNEDEAKNVIGDGVIYGEEESSDNYIQQPFYYGTQTVYGSRWTYKTDALPHTYYESEKKYKNDDGTGGTFVPTKKTHAFIYEVEEMEVPGYASDVDEKAIQPATTPGDTATKIINIINRKMGNPVGTLVIKKDYTGPVFATKNADGTINTQANNMVMFHVLGMFGSQVVCDRYSPIKFTGSGSDSVTLTNLVVGATYTVTELAYSKDGYVPAEGVDTVQVQVMPAPPENGDENSPQTPTITFEFKNATNGQEEPNQGIINRYVAGEDGFQQL